MNILMKEKNTLQIQLRMTSYHYFYLNRLVLLIREKSKKILPNAKLQQVFLPERFERYTLLRSPHVDKKARDQFARNTQTRLLNLTINNVENIPATLRDLNVFFSYINSCLIGVSVSIRTRS